MIASAAEKLVSLQERLLEFRRELTIGIARDTLIVDDNQLDPANPVYRDLAVHLFNAKVAFLTVQSGASAKDVRLFFEILAYPGDQVAAAGGLAALLAYSGIHGFIVREIDYRAFHATEVDSMSAPKVTGVNEESAVLWKEFISGMAGGTVNPNGVRQLPKEQFDPVLLAEALNREQQIVSGKVTESYDQAIADFLNRSGSQRSNSQSHREFFDRLGLLIEQLSPELRRRFLNSTLKSFSSNPVQATEVLANWSHSIIIEALEQVNSDQLQVPRILLDILGKMVIQGKVAEGQGYGISDRVRNYQQTAEFLNRMFRDGEIESYVPKDYSDALSVLAAADIATHLDPAQVDEFLDDLNGHALERQFCAITLELMEQGVGSRSIDAISLKFEEMVPYFLEAGDFQSLTGIHRHLCRLRAESQPIFAAAVQRFLDSFTGDNFVTQVLDGLDEWGKDLYPTIREMISQIGIPFVEPLLDRLAEEPVMMRRRLYMEYLQCIGVQASGFIVRRLNDPRWYFVRNLVVLLREINDPEALRPLNRLFAHAHPKVRLEVMQTFLHFNDPRADRYLLHELEKTDVGFLNGIVRLAANSRNPEVACRLADLLNSRGNSESELALKGVIISSLAKMACAQALPGLAAFIESRSLFMSKALLRLKLEAVASLSRYDCAEAVMLASRIRQKSTGGIAEAAEKVCQQLRGSSP